MKTKAPKVPKKAAKPATAKARLNKLPKGSSLVVPISKRNVITHTIRVPKNTDEVVVRIILDGKVKSLSYIGPSSDPPVDPD